MYCHKLLIINIIIICYILPQVNSFILPSILLPPITTIPLPNIPLTPIDLTTLRDNVATSIDIVRDAYVYDSLNTAVAVGISESFAGAISALASRSTATFLGDVKVDSLKTKISSTTAFFGTRGLIKAGFTILGN